MLTPWLMFALPPPVLLELGLAKCGLQAKSLWSLVLSSKLRMDFTFLSAWKRNWKHVIFVTHGNDLKFKFQCPSIKFLLLTIKWWKFLWKYLFPVSSILPLGLQIPEHLLSGSLEKKKKAKPYVRMSYCHCHNFWITFPDFILWWVLSDPRGQADFGLCVGGCCFSLLVKKLIIITLGSFCSILLKVV